MASRPLHGLVPVMAALTLVTGMVEAVSFLTLGLVFTAMQTGNVLFLGFALAGEGALGQGPGALSATAAAVSLAAFAGGVFLGARVERTTAAHGRHWLVLALFAEVGLLAVAAGLAWSLQAAPGAPTGRHLATTAVLAPAMGMRNVTAMRARVPDLPTTLVTRATTALIGGSPLGHDPVLGTGAVPLARRAVSVLAMLAGGVLGAWLLHVGGSPGQVLGAAAAVDLGVAVTCALALRNRPPVPT